MKRRTFLVGSLSGATLLALAACTPEKPAPTLVPVPTTKAPPSAKPTAFLRTKWAGDPFALGSQSYLTVGSTPSDRSTMSQPVDKRLFMAGEATSMDQPGTVSGAWLSGIRAATEVASYAASGERIAVVGAGIAGAVTARQLAAAGFDVVVLEARNRIGGRINTVATDAWPFPIECGAAMVRSVAGSTMIGELDALKVSTKLFDETREIRTAKGAVVKLPAAVPSTVAAAIDWAKTAPADVSIAAALNQVDASLLSSPQGADGVSDVDWLQHYLRAEVEEQNGAPADSLSARFGWEPDQPGGDRIVVGGYQKLVRGALNNIDVRLSSVVTTVSYGKGTIGIRFASGESLQADRIVMTVPLGVLKTDAITFDPPLPAAQKQAIKALGMGVIDKVFLRFEQPFWQTDAQVWSSLDPKASITDWINLEPVTGDAVLVGLVAAEQAAALAKLDDATVKAEALASLAPFSAS